LPWEMSKWFVRFALEEYLADKLGNLVLGASMTMTAAGGTRPVRYSDLGGDYLGPAEAAFNAIPGTIHRYRVGQIDLDTMLRDTFDATQGILISLAHAQAMADSGDPDTPVDSGNPGVPANPLAARLPDPLRLAWKHIVQAFDQGQLLSGAARFAAAEQAVLEAASLALVRMWQELGLTFRPEGDGYYATVAGPTAS
jgi:hypothetical protein